MEGQSYNYLWQQTIQWSFYLYGQTAQPADSSPSRGNEVLLAGSAQKLWTVAMFFGLTAQTRRLRQPRPAAAAAADQNVGESQY